MRLKDRPTNHTHNKTYGEAVRRTEEQTVTQTMDGQVERGTQTWT